MSLGGGKTRQEILYPDGQPERRKKRAPKTRRTSKVKPPDANKKLIAEMLHDWLCWGDHDSDGTCAWYLTSWDDQTEPQQHYLKKAAHLLKRLGGDVDLARGVIFVLRR